MTKKLKSKQNMITNILLFILDGITNNFQENHYKLKKLSHEIASIVKELMLSMI